MQLFGSLCHELRTPLNCSISFLDLYRQLKEGSEDENDVKEFIEPSLRSNQLMLNMVNDILDFVQMTDNKFKFTPLQFDLYEMIEECLMLIKIHADIKNIQLSIKKNDLVPKFIVSDPNRVRQIILNFLSNALKFTKQLGKISIELNGLDTTIDSITQVSSVIRVSVHDTGVGISKQNIRKIFEIFNKTDHKDSALNPNGCGIGLPLSNSLAKLIGPSQPILMNHSSGSSVHIQSGIQVESVEGKGSTFSFLIQDLNTKQKQEKLELDIQESCNVSEMGDYVVEQGLSNIDSNRVRSFSNINIQHSLPLKIKQETVGGLQINSFQQDIINQLHYLQDSQDRRKTVQSSVMRSSVKTESNTGNLERLPSTFNPKQKRIAEGIKNTKTNTSETFENYTSNKQPTQSIPKIQSLQAFTFPNSSSFAPYEISGQSPLNNIILPHYTNKMNSSLSQYQQDFKNELKNQQFSNSINNMNSHSQIKNITNTSIYTQRTTNTQDVEVLQPSYQYQQQIPIQQQTQLSQQNPQITLQIQQISSKQPQIQQQNQNTPQNQQQSLQNQQQTQMNQQVQIQKNLLDKNNFSLNSKGEETKILIADDSGFNVMVLKKIIQLFHIQNIHICHDGQEAVQKIRYILSEKMERLYDIIFMDLDMPIMNGYEACKQIKQMIDNYEVSEKLYVIACSAYGMSVKDEHTYHISQMDDAIVKPVKKDQVLNIFQTFLRDKPKA